MKKHLPSLLSVLALFGCANAPIISNPAEAPNTPALGDVTGISKHLAGKNRAVVVFMHGVGDHCPGYALDGDFGWLRNAITPSLGLKAQGPGPSAPIDILDSEFMPDRRPDSASNVTFITRDFSYTAADGHDVDIHAVEITWSQLTQWVKTKQLGYDLTEPPDKPQSETPSCPYVADVAYKKPPSRQWLNRSLKESVLDRSLVDAVLYAGAYGKVMRRGVAEALCLALEGTKNDSGKLCTWPALPDKPVRRQTAYFFVTHSLGSRMIYDTLLGLTGHDVNQYVHTFEQTEIDAAKDYVDDMAVHTAAFYMMANQLPLLGLAYEDGTQSSTDGPEPYLSVREGSPINQALSTMPPGSAPSAQVTGNVATTAAVRPGVTEFAARRMKSASDKGEQILKLKVVAFSDANDLLSWGIPAWYQVPRDGSTPEVDFTNVYVQNSSHWFGVFENPAAAHANYFVNPEVWRVIRCGAKGGVVNSCR